MDNTPSWLFSTWSWNTIFMSRRACAHSQLSTCLSWACAHLSHLHFSMCTLPVEHAHALSWACAHLPNLHFSTCTCTLSVEHVHGLQKQTFCVRFCNPKVRFCNPNKKKILFVTQKKNKKRLQKGTGYKKERFWVTKKNVTVCYNVN